LTAYKNPRQEGADKSVRLDPKTLLLVSES